MENGQARRQCPRTVDQKLVTAEFAEIAEKSEGICPAHSANVSAISAVKGFALDCHAGINSNAG